MKAPSGLLGGAILPTFVDAVKNSSFAKLILIGSKETEATKKAVADVAAGKVESVVVSYSDKAAVTSALKGVDVIVSTLGGHGAQIPLEQILIEAGE